MLKYLLDEDEFLSPYGIRSLSKVHDKHPFVMDVGGDTYTVGYVPGESNTYVFGGNSNWRGPVWLCGEITTCTLCIRNLYRVALIMNYLPVVDTRECPLTCSQLPLVGESGALLLLLW